MVKNIKKTAGKKSIIICSIIIVKLMLMGIFSSDYQDNMFRPFVDIFLEGKDPYRYYYDNQLLDSFPYLPLMLLVESVGGFIIKILDPGLLFLRNLIFKLPLLAFDLIGYVFLRKMGMRFKYAVIFYFCSPIILYATYMHGQLDIIPTALLIVSVYHSIDWKKKDNLFWSAVILGMALSTKFHILAAVPLMVLYVSTKKGLWISLRYLFITIMTVGIFVVGFMGDGLIENVFLNKEQSVLFKITFDYGNTQILIPFFVLFIIYFKTFELDYFNKNLLISLLGLLFSVFLICIPSMPAWFTWIVPFVALYFGYVQNNRYKIMLIYGGFNLIYLVYFLFLHQTGFVDLYFLGKSLQFLKIENTEIKYIVFTLMVAFLGMVVYKIYEFGVASNSLYQRRDVPFTIGIAGDSGAGKSRLLEKIEHLFGTGRDILFIEGDGDHRWERGNENWEIHTALDPKANFLYRQAADIHALRAGDHVERMDYDHDLGTFTPSFCVHPKKYIVLCGLHSLYLPQLRKELDLKIYMDTDDRLRKFWKIERDSKHRGYQKEQIMSQIEKRIPDAKKYIYPQKEYADLVITYFDKTLKSCFAKEHTVVLSVKISLDININLENVIKQFGKYGVHPKHKISEDFRRQEIFFDGKEVEKHTIMYQNIAESVIIQYEDLFTYDPQWEEGTEGIIQLFLLIMISQKMEGGGGMK